MLKCISEQLKGMSQFAASIRRQRESTLLPDRILYKTFLWTSSHGNRWSVND